MEYRRKCTVCGKIYCYTDADVSSNNSNSILASLSSIATVAQVFGGTSLGAYAMSERADKFSNRIVDFKRCPNCNSASTIELTVAEWQEEQAKFQSAAAIGTLPTAEKESIDVNVNATTDSLLQRVHLFLEDSEWETADAYCEKILDVEPQNSYAYLGKFMAELHAHNLEELVTRDLLPTESGNYKKAVRFADSELSTLFSSLPNERAYYKASQRKNAAKDFADFQAAESMFRAISGFRDATEQADYCKQKATEADKDARYRRAQYAESENSSAALEKAIKEYEGLGAWKDSPNRLKVCRERLKDAIKQEKERERVKQEAAERRDAELRAQNEVNAKKAKQRRKIIITSISSVLLIAVGVVFAARVIIPNTNYRKAEKMVDAGQYEEAIAAFSAMDDYKDSKSRIQEAYYLQGKVFAESGDYEKAIIAFQLAGDYEGASDRITETYYQYGSALAKEQNYTDAIKAFISAGDYKDAKERILEMHYLNGNALLFAERYDSAVDAFKAANDYEDSRERLLEAYYQWGLEFLERGAYENAIDCFDSTRNYKDTNERISESYYLLAEQFKEKKDYEIALTYYQKAGFWYKDVEAQKDEVVQRCYDAAIEKSCNNQYAEASHLFEIISAYMDVSDYIKGCGLMLTNYDEFGEEFNLQSLYNQIDDLSVSSEFKSQLLNLPQMQTLLQLNGTWVGTIGRDQKKTISFNYGQIRDGNATFTLYYSKSDGYYYSYWNSTIKTYLRNIGDNSFEYTLTNNNRECHVFNKQ